jgi:hypothetical protein
MAAGDFGNSPQRDLAIGVPGEDVGAGAVNVLRATQNGLASFGDSFWKQGLGLRGDAEDGDGFARGQYD